MGRTSDIPPKPSYSARQAYFGSRVLRDLFRDEKATAEVLTEGLELTIVNRTYQP
jgi:hypothetical protein